MNIAYVNIFVTDLERAIVFYENVGLTLETSSLEHGYASLSAGPIRLGLAVALPDQKELIGRHTGIGFAVHDLQSEHRRLVQSGVIFPMAPEEQPWGGFLALAQEPDVNIFYLDQIDDG